jgi:hypothetical protein
MEACGLKRVQNVFFYINRCKNFIFFFKKKKDYLYLLWTAILYHPAAIACYSGYLTQNVWFTHINRFLFLNSDVFQNRIKLSANWMISPS